MAEVFSGDPYNVAGGAVQIGLRHFISEQVQIDATCGAGVWGEPPEPFWASAGVRLVTSELW